MKEKKSLVQNGVITAVFLSLVFFIATSTAFASGDNANHIAVFLGATDSETTDFTSGLDYERRLPFLHSMFGVGLTYERISLDKKDINLYFANFIAHPWKGLKFNVSPGKERKKGKTYDIFRYGVAYDFDVGKFSVTPTVNIDTVKGETSEVYGVAFGMGF